MARVKLAIRKAELNLGFRYGYLHASSQAVFSCLIGLSITDPARISSRLIMCKAYFPANFFHGKRERPERSSRLKTHEKGNSVQTDVDFHDKTISHSILFACR